MEPAGAERQVPSWLEGSCSNKEALQILKNRLTNVEVEGVAQGGVDAKDRLEEPAEFGSGFARPHSQDVFVIVPLGKLGRVRPSRGFFSRQHEGDVPANFKLVELQEIQQPGDRPNVLAFLLVRIFVSSFARLCWPRKSNFGRGRGSRAPTGLRLRRACLRLRRARHKSSEGFGRGRASRAPTGTLLCLRLGRAGFSTSWATSGLRHNSGRRLFLRAAPDFNRRPRRQRWM